MMDKIEAAALCVLPFVMVFMTAYFADARSLRKPRKQAAYFNPEKNKHYGTSFAALVKQVEEK